MVYAAMEGCKEEEGKEKTEDRVLPRPEHADYILARTSRSSSPPPDIAILALCCILHFAFSLCTSSCILSRASQAAPPPPKN